MPEAYIYESVRTPRGRGEKGGALYEVKPIDLLAAALLALRERTGISPEELDDVIIGCATPIDGQGYNIAKAALLHAGWGDAVSGMQVNRHCASGFLSAATVSVNPTLMLTGPAPAGRKALQLAGMEVNDTGLVALCVGGGMGVATVVERV